jgi:hypothetical protein
MNSMYNMYGMEVPMMPRNMMPMDMKMHMLHTCINTMKMMDKMTKD